MVGRVGDVKTEAKAAAEPKEPAKAKNGHGTAGAGRLEILSACAAREGSKRRRVNNNERGGAALLLAAAARMEAGH